MENDSPDSAEFLQATYGHRFSDRQMRDKQIVWQVLTKNLLQTYVPPTGSVLDLGAGFCEFINNIQASTKLAVDLNPETKRFAASDVKVLQTSSTDLSMIPSGTIDSVFTSNFFEHLSSTQELLQTLRECSRVMTDGGNIIILMPNIRNLPGAYWDYLDHKLPLTHLSLCEALELSGFTPVRVEPRFLPYTVKNSLLPVTPTAVKIYLRAKLAWRILGKQMLVIARR